MGDLRCFQCGISIKQRLENFHTPLCSICTIFAACLSSVEKMGGPNMDEIVDPQFLQRDLKMNYDVTYYGSVQDVYTKVYTCTECLGPKQYLNPFKCCIKCVVTQWPDALDKTNASTFLKKQNCSLMDTEMVFPYLRKRNELKQQRKLTLRTLYFKMGSDYRGMDFISEGTASLCCNIDGVSTRVNVLPVSSCPRDHQDEDAVEAIKEKRVTAIVAESSIIPDVAKMIVDLESIQPACDSSGKLGIHFQHLHQPK